MILLPKYKTVSVDRPVVGMTTRIKGEIRLVRYNAMGQVNLDTGWKPNLWLNQGLDNWATQSDTMFNYFALGDGATAPAITDTQLAGTYLGSSNSNNGTADTASFAGAPNYEQSTTRNRRFGPGVATGTIREVVMSNTSGNPGTAISIRALVSPVVTKASDETLDVFYKWTCFPQLADATGSVVIDSLTYDYIQRLCDVDSTTGGTRSMIRPTLYLLFATSTLARGDGSTLGTNLEGAPTGGTRDYGDTTAEIWLSYTPGNYYRDQYINIGLNAWNTGSGIRTTYMAARPWDIKCRFGRQGGGDETIPKDSTKVIEDYTIRWSWARHV